MAAGKAGVKYAKEKCWAVYLSGSILFLSTLPTKLMFHMVVEGIMTKLRNHGEHRLVDYAQNNVFRWNRGENKWEAPWFAGMLGDFPSGLTPITVYRAMESLWHALRGALPGNVASNDLGAAQEALKHALRAVFSSRHWVDKDDHGHHHLRSVFGGLPPWHCNLMLPLQRCLCGSPICVERDPGASGLQGRVPSMLQLARHAPMNFQRSQVRAGPCGYFGHLYTMPLSWANMLVDEHSHVLNMAILTAENQDQLEKPLLAAGVPALRMY